MPASAVAVADVPAQPTKRRRVARLAVVAEPAARYVNGLKVVEERPVLSNLPIPEGRDPADFAIRGFTQLVMEDGSTLYACADCDFADARGAVMKHRGKAHGARVSGRKSRTANAEIRGGAVTDDVRSMSLGDVLAMADQLNQLGVVIDNVMAQRDEWKDRATAAETRLRKLTLALNRAGFVEAEVGE